MYSSIISKKCKCGCNLWPTTGYQGYNSQCRPDLVEKKMKEQKERQKKANAVVKDTRGLKKLAVSNDYVREKQKEHQSKSQLLQQADRLFGGFIKRRDTKKNGQAECPCCENDVLVELNGKQNPDCNVMHFVDRDVYFLRFDEDNAHAGHSNCNRNQHYNPNGKEYHNYRKYLVDKIGEAAVAEMELVKRQINKISEQDLRNVIDHYKTEV